MIYMAVSNDKYELSCAVAEDAAKLAKMCGITRGYIYTCISKGKVCRDLNVKFVRVKEERNE